METIPASGTVSGNPGSTVTLATVEIPAGETWLIAATGTMTNVANGRANWCELAIGSASATIGGAGGMATTAQGTTTIRMRRNYSIGSDSFTGHVYTVKM